LHSIYKVVIDALTHVSRRGKRVVWFYTFSLVLIALFDGFGGNLAGSVRWFHVVSRHGAIRHVEIVIVNGTPGFVVE